jgi:hypothetical protein
MSYLSQLQAAATQAQLVIAQMTGMSGDTNATIDGNALIVVTDASQRGEELMIGGRIVTLALTASATRTQSVFDSFTPAAGMAFVHDGATYKILTSEKDGLHWRFNLGHPSQ